MNNKWVEALLEDVVIFETGNRNSQDYVIGGCYPFFICSKEILEHNEYDFDKEAVIMAGNNANAIFHLHYFKGKFAARQRTYIISPKYGDLSCRFFYYLLQYLQPYFRANSQGTTTKFLTIGTLKNTPISLPPVVDQKAIANILGTIDEKIAMNQKTNSILEEMVKTIFKSWFIDFDPVTANAEKLSNELPKEISDLFPDTFENSQFGKIPKGWEIKKLGDYVTIKRGGSPRPIKDFIIEDGIPWVKISDATSSKNRFISSTKESIKSDGLSKTILLKKGSLILSNSATPGIPKFLDLDACIHDGWLYFPEKDIFSDLYLYQLFLSIRASLCLLGNGSVFTNLKTDILKNYEIIIPSKKCLDAFDKQIDSLHQKCKNLMKNSNCLSEMRRILLPKLISGEVKIQDAEKIIEEVGI